MKGSGVHFASRVCLIFYSNRMVFSPIVLTPILKSFAETVVMKKS